MDKTNTAGSERHPLSVFQHFPAGKMLEGPGIQEKGVLERTTIISLDFSASIACLTVFAFHSSASKSTCRKHNIKKGKGD